MSAKNPVNLIRPARGFPALPRGGGSVGRVLGRRLLPGEQFPRGISGWSASASLQPQDVSFASFAGDFEDLYESHRACDDDFFYVGSAYWGIPWLEAILGCPVSVAAANCRAEPCGKIRDDAGGLDLNIESNPWLDACFGSPGNWSNFSRGRFPVCPPLLRGAGDAASAMLGGTAFVIGLLEEPEKMRNLLEHCSAVRLAVVRRLARSFPPGTDPCGRRLSQQSLVPRYRCVLPGGCRRAVESAPVSGISPAGGPQACQAAEVEFHSSPFGLSVSCWIFSWKTARSTCWKSTLTTAAPDRPCRNSSRLFRESSGRGGRCCFGANARRMIGNSSAGGSVRPV